MQVDSQFKASKGWFYKFSRRNNMEERIDEILRQYGVK